MLNGEATLERCLGSVESQSCTNREVIVVDGGSTDATLDVVLRHTGSVGHWISERDEGIPDAWNKGVTLARGTWVLFLGADDYFLTPGALDEAKRLLDVVEETVGIAYGKVALTNKQGEVLDLAGLPWTHAGPHFSATMSLPHQGVFHRRSWFDSLGPYDVRLKVCADYEYILRTLRLRPPRFLPDLVVSAAQQGGISGNPANSMILLRELRTAQRKNGITHTPWRWTVAWCKVRLRQILWVVLGEAVTRRCLDLGRRLLGKAPVWTKM